MAVSKERSDWALLILRVGAGGFAILHGLGPVLNARGSVTFANALRLGEGLLEMVCGGLLVVGVWTLPSALVLVGLAGVPMVKGWMHGGRILGDASGLLRVLATLASGIGGPGKWSPSR